MFKRIESSTKKEWLDIRRKVLTATEIGIILGLNPWKMPRDIKKNGATEDNFVENAYTKLGQWLEPVVVQSVNEVLGTSFELFENKAFYADFEVGLGATPDAGDGKMLLECKTTKTRNWVKYQSLPPLYYVVQLYTQMMCCERGVGMLAILGTDLTQISPKLNLDLAIFSLTRDEEIDMIILREVQRFWECHAEGKQYRVNRKQVLGIELKLMCLLDKVV